MKSKLNRLANVILVAMTLFLLWQRLSAIIHNFKMESQKVNPFTLPSIDGKTVSIPADGKRILIFWATWCLPCEVELGRFKRSVKKNTIDPKLLYTINMGEEADVVRAHLEKQNYPFVHLLDPRGTAQEKLSVSITPTIVHLLPSGEIQNMGSGSGPLTVLRAESFLQVGKTGDEGE